MHFTIPFCKTENMAFIFQQKRNTPVIFSCNYKFFLIAKMQTVIKYLFLIKSYHFVDDEPHLSFFKNLMDSLFCVEILNMNMNINLKSAAILIVFGSK